MADNWRPREPTREPNGTLWFGAELDPGGDQVWFRIAEEAIGRMPAETPSGRGRRLVDALIAKTWSVKPPVSAYCSRTRRPVSFIRSPSSRALRGRRGRNGLGGERGETVGDVRVRLDARFGPVPGVSNRWASRRAISGSGSGRI